jgi:CBS-domain-containing membrane protein
MIKAGLLKSARVRDVMTESVVFLRSDDPIETAWDAMHRHGISGAPVLDRHGKLVGIVSMADLADPRHRPPTCGGTLEDAMTRVVYAVKADDPVLHAVRLMLRERVHRAMVVNEDGTVAGIIAPMDVLRAPVRGDPLAEPSPRPSDGEMEFVDLRALGAA